MVDDETTDPDRRAIRTSCPDHGMQHGYYTAEDEGKIVELPCAREECAFRESYRVRWPLAFKVKPEAQADGQP